MAFHLKLWTLKSSRNCPRRCGKRRTHCSTAGRSFARRRCIRLQELARVQSYIDPKLARSSPRAIPLRPSSLWDAAVVSTRLPRALPSKRDMTLAVGNSRRCAIARKLAELSPSKVRSARDKEAYNISAFRRVG